MKKLIAIMTCFSLNIAQAGGFDPLFLADGQVLNLSKRNLNILNKGESDPEAQKFCNKLLEKIERQSQPEYNNILDKDDSSLSEGSSSDSEDDLELAETPEAGKSNIKPIPELTPAERTKYHENVKIKLGNIKIIDLRYNLLNSNGLDIFVKKLEEKEYLESFKNLKLLDLSSNDIDKSSTNSIVTIIEKTNVRFIDLMSTEVSMINILKLLKDPINPKINQYSDHLIFLTERYYKTIQKLVKESSDVYNNSILKNITIDKRYESFKEAMNNNLLSLGFYKSHDNFFYGNKDIVKLKSKIEADKQYIARANIATTLLGIPTIQMIETMQIREKLLRESNLK